MRALFNGDCSKCKMFRPRCATIHLAGQFGWITLCDVCRRQLPRGSYRLHDQHRPQPIEDNHGRA